VTTLKETIHTPLSTEAAFAYVADFASSQEWDPGVATAERVGDGPIGVGTRYRLGVRIGNRVAPMEYRITELDPPNRVVLVGSGSGVSAVDTIEFGRTATGTTVDYTADIRLDGIRRLAQPFLGKTFAKIARDASAGMQRELDARAARERTVAS
jgi:dehydrogenase/reductase SDR family protein 12